MLCDFPDSSVDSSGLCRVNGYEIANALIERQGLVPFATAFLMHGVARCGYPIRETGERDYVR